MKLYLLFPLLALMEQGQLSKPDIKGKWLYEGTVNKNNQIDCCTECPNLIEFYSNDSYKVLNDCYGVDPRKPVIETGKWGLEQPSNKLILRERKFMTNSYFYSPKKTIELEIVSIGGKKLKVKYSQGKTEQYNREK